MAQQVVHLSLGQVAGGTTSLREAHGRRAGRSQVTHEMHQLSGRRQKLFPARLCRRLASLRACAKCPHEHSLSHESLVDSREIIRSDESQHAIVAERPQTRLAAENVAGSAFGEVEAHLAVLGLMESVSQLHHATHVLTVFACGVLMEEKMEAAADERKHLVFVGSL